MSNPQPIGSVWTHLSHDPRDPQSALLRASDRDRDVVTQVLGDAYADGRLDREEFDTRAEAVAAAKVLGDIPPLVRDLVPVDGGSAVRLSSPDELRGQATESWRRDVRSAMVGMAGPSAITTGIWGATAVANGGPYFFWPMFVILGTGVHLTRTWFGKQDIIEAKRRKLERRERARIERRDRKAPPAS